ncbi:MAG TPA: hypothetical protein VGM43_01960 [Bryobacteraceae bacterium]
MSEIELKAMWQRLGRLSHSQLIEVFHRVHESCRMRGDCMPGAQAMRELAMIWHLAQAWEERTEREQDRLSAVA